MIPGGASEAVFSKVCIVFENFIFESFVCPVLYSKLYSKLFVVVLAPLKYEILVLGPCLPILSKATRKHFYRGDVVIKDDDDVFYLFLQNKK